jgi:Na+/proline symporter
MKLLGLLQAADLPSASQPAIIAFAAGYFVVVALIGAWATRRTRTAADFFVAGQGIGLIALTLSAMSATLSGFAFIGGPGLVYMVGLGAMFLLLPAAVTNSMGAWVLAKRMRLLAEVRPIMTVPDAVGARYNSRLAQGLAGVGILIAAIGYMGSQMLALGFVIDAIFGTGLAAGIWLGMGVTLAYSVAGGIVAGIYTDVFQGALMALASVLVFLFVLDIGGGMSGLSNTILSAEPGFLGPWGTLGPVAALSFFFVFGVGSLGQPHIIHKFYMLRDPRMLRFYPLLVTSALIVTMLLYFGVGVAVKSLVLTGQLEPLAAADNATPVFLLRFTPVLLAALVFSGVAAAIMSTVNSFMNIAAAVVTHDLPTAFGRPLRNELAWGRASTVLLSMVAALIAQFSGQLIAFLGIFGWGLFASTLVPALAIGLNWSGATRAGAIASISVGLVITAVCGTMVDFLRLYTFPAGVTVSGLSLVASIVVFFVVSYFTTAGGGTDIDADVRLTMEV